MYSLPTFTLVGVPPSWLIQGHRLNFSTNSLMEKVYMDCLWIACAGKKWLGPHSFPYWT